MTAQAGAVHIACRAKSETDHFGSFADDPENLLFEKQSGAQFALRIRYALQYGRKHRHVLNKMDRRAGSVTKSAGIHIGKVIRHAVVFNTQRWPEVRFRMDDLLDAVNDLFDLLQKRRISYALVGGIALLRYVQGRNTEDIDLILSVRSLKRLPEIDIAHRDIYFAHGNYQGLQIDVLLTSNPLFSHVKKRHVVRQDFFERSIPSATVRGLILLKLYALPSLYRQGDFVRVGLYENDVATLMFYHAPNMSEILAELTPFVSPQDMSAIQDIISDLEQRIARLRRDRV